MPMLLRNRFVTEGGVPPDIPQGAVPHPTIGPVCFAVLQNLSKRSCYGQFQFRASRVLVVCAEFFHNAPHFLRSPPRDAAFANNIGLECRLSKGPACRREFNSREPVIFSGPGISSGPAGRPPETAFAGEKRKLSKESSAYKDWADKEVRWIITDEEREAFKLLTNDEEREKFVESFWIRRDPTPDTVENEFRDQYYQRVLYANERFSAGIPGSMTDRGRIYIIYGPPDEIESHPSGGTYDYSVQPRQGLNANVPLRTLALPLYCGCRPGYRH